MKRIQKKYTKKNHKGGLVDKNVSEISLGAIQKRLKNIELNLDEIKAKMGEINTVEGRSRENDTGLDEAGFKEQEIPLQNNPMKANFASNPSTSGKEYNGSTPITTNQYDEVDNLNIKIKSLQKDPKINKEKLKTLNGLKNALFAKYQKRVDYLENEQQARTLSQDESDELSNLKANLNPNEPFGGGRKSRRHRKSRKGKRTRKYKK
jgi:hypothetical protein